MEDILAQPLVTSDGQNLVVDAETQRRILHENRPAECRLANEPVSPTNRHCTREVSVKLNLVELMDGSHFYVEELHLRHRENIAGKEICIGQRLMPNRRRRIARKASLINCDDAEHCRPRSPKMCWHPVSEVATLILKNVFEIPIRAWGTVSTLVYRAPDNDDTLTLTCPECGIKCVGNDMFTVEYNHFIQHVGTCTFKGCESIDALANITGMRRAFKLPPTAPRYVKAQFWRKGVIIAANQTECPKLDPCREVNCVLCMAFLHAPDCKPGMPIFITVVLLFLLGLIGLCIAYCLRCGIGKSKRKRRNSDCSNRSNCSISNNQEAIALRNLSLTEYRSVPTNQPLDDEDEEVLFQYHPSIAGRMPRFLGQDAPDMAIRYRRGSQASSGSRRGSGSSALGPIVEEPEDTPSSTMRRQIAHLLSNVADVTNSAADSSRAPRRHSLGIVDRSQSSSFRVSARVCHHGARMLD